MATNLELTTTYAGEVAGGYIAEAFLGNESLQHITVKTDIPFQQVVRRLTDNATTFDESSCDFTPGGEITIDERLLTLKKLSFQRNLCINDFGETWDALQAQNDNINNVVDAAILTGLGIIGQINEPMVWTGAASSTSYDGFLTKFALDNTINEVATPQALSASNIIAKIQLLIAESPTRVKRASEKPVIYMSQFAWECYMYAQVGAGFATYLTNGPAVNPTFMGLYSIAVCPGMPDSTMIMAQPSNLWFGTNKLADWNNITAVDMTAWAEKNVRMRADFYAGVEYGFGAEIAAYGIGLS